MSETPKKKFGWDGMKLFGKALENIFLKIKDAVKSVNGIEADDDGDIKLKTVPFAQGLESDSSQRVYGAFVQRMAGGEASLSDGDAWLLVLRGDNDHEDYVAESLQMEVIAVERADPITATIDRDTFVAYVEDSGTITLAYSSDWTADPELYGITITGTPVSGDVITISYVKEERGTIHVSDPRSLVATGWNLFNPDTGYARVCKYASGYRIEGTYTSLQYSVTESGSKSDIVVTDGNFDIPGDGFVWVNGGNAEDTVVYATWDDWTEEGSFGEYEPYTESEVDITSVMTSYFPYGLLKAGSVVDEIDLNLGQAISRVERMAYSEANRAIAEASGREYEFDENYIYLARTAAAIAQNTHSISVSGGFTTNDHGIEFFTYTSFPVYSEILYGKNLKNELERNVLKKSSQELTEAQKTQVRQNIGAERAGRLDSLFIQRSFSASYSLASGAGKVFSEADLNYSIPAGYKPFSVSFVNTGKNTVAISGTRLYFTSASINVRVVNNSAATEGGTVTVCVIFIKDEGGFDYDN